MDCKNCGHSFEGNFCSNCGQTANIHRVTFKHFTHELFHAFTHADKGFLLLAKSLITRPGYVAREYLDGKRKTYFNPLSFLVISTALYAYVSYQSGYFKAMTAAQPHRSHTQAVEPTQEPPYLLKIFFQSMEEAQQISFNNGKLLGLFLIYPLLSFFTWILFKKSKTNLAENLVLGSFIMSEGYLLLTVIFIPIFLVTPSYVVLNNYIYHFIFLIFMTVAYRQFFKQNIILSFLKAFLVMVLYVTFFWLLIVAYVFVKKLIF
jgi:hypothetical protein